MSKITHCQQCLIPHNLLLLDDYYPVGQSYCSSLPANMQERITRISIGSTGLCLYCQQYNQNYDPDFLQQELKAFVRSAKDKTVVLALSGGKDSLSALYLAHLMGLNVRAFLYQNGFIPDSIVDFAQAICKNLNIPLEIYTHHLDQAFRDEYYFEKKEMIAKSGLDFCSLCAKHLNVVALKHLKKHNSQWILLGNKVYAQLSPRVSAIKKHRKQKYSFCSINFLFALRISQSQQDKILSSIAWRPPKLKGYTSNCLIPGFVEQARRRRLGSHSDQGYIEMELRSGAYTLEEAEQLLSVDEDVDESSVKTYFKEKGWSAPHERTSGSASI